MRLEQILDCLQNQNVRTNTKKVYHRIWTSFNKFLIKLDRKPKLWEDRVTLFLVYITHNGAQSSRVKSYLSAIKCILKVDKYKWDDTKILIRSLTQACKLINDRVMTRMHIHKALLNLILHEIHREFQNQFYLATMYRALFALGYYGLFRVGELTYSSHVAKACNVHVGTNKRKILVILYTSKTHSKANIPQKIKISSNECQNKRQELTCPFTLMRNFIKIRGNFKSDSEPLFIFWDGNPVTPAHANKTLKSAIASLGLDPSIYRFHSLRIGRTTDLMKVGFSIEKIK